jgi:hypothetical protein
MQGLGCCPLQLTEPWPGAVSGSLIGAVDWVGGTMLAGNGFMPLLIVGAGMT